MELNLGIRFDFGDGVFGTLYGGPFKNYKPGTRRLVGLKMAEEIKHKHDFAVDTPDFGVPDVTKTQDAMLWVLEQFKEGNDVYVGCMGGTGRTGLLIGCMVKVYMDWCADAGIDCDATDPVLYTREHYKPHAIETPDQEVFVRTFDTHRAMMRLVAMTTPKVQYVTKTVEVEKIVYLSPFDWAMNTLFGHRR